MSGKKTDNILRYISIYDVIWLYLLEFSSLIILFILDKKVLDMYNLKAFADNKITLFKTSNLFEGQRAL